MATRQLVARFAAPPNPLHLGFFLDGRGLIWVTGSILSPPPLAGATDYARLQSSWWAASNSANHWPALGWLPAERYGRSILSPMQMPLFERGSEEDGATRVYDVFCAPYLLPYLSMSLMALVGKNPLNPWLNKPWLTVERCDLLAVDSPHGVRKVPVRYLALGSIMLSLPIG